MGKMKGNIYRYYMLKLTDDPSARPKYECRFCSKQYVQNATKMRHHVLNACNEIPAPLKLALLDIPNLTSQDESNDEIQDFLNTVGMNSPPEGGKFTPKKATPSTPSSSSSSFIKSGPGTPKKRKSTSSSSTPSTSHVQSKIANTGNSIFSPSNNSANISSYFNHESLYILLARAIFASGASLSLLENPYWQEVFQRIAPEITLPTKKDLIKDLLEREYNKIQEDVGKQILDAKYLSIQCETWFNNRQESMITVGLNTPTPYSYKTYLTSSVNHHDPAIIAEHTLQAIEEIDVSKVLSLVTSSTRHMRSAWEKIMEAHPNLIVFGCAVEALTVILANILEHELIAELVSVLKNVCIKIKKHSSVKIKYEQLQSELYDGKVRKLYIPSTTTSSSPFSSSSSTTATSSNSKKWLSTVLFLQSVGTTEMALKCLAMEDAVQEIIGDEELSILLSEDVWVKVDILCKILAPVVKWLAYMKHGTERPEIYLVPKAFSEIQEAFEKNSDKYSDWKDSVLRELLECVNKRKKLCVHSVHLAAALLDPTEQGAYLNQDQVLQATEFIDSFCELHGYDSAAVVAELSEFRLKVDFYSKPFLWKVTEKLKGAVWWKTIAKKSHLAQVASAILNISPATFSIDNALNDDADERILGCSSSSSFTAAASSSTNNSTVSRDCKLIFVTHNLRLRSRVLKNEAKKLLPSPPSPGEIPSVGDKTLSNGFDLTSLESVYNLSESESEMEEEEDEDQVHEIVLQNQPQNQQNLNQEHVQVQVVKIDLKEVKSDSI